MRAALGRCRPRPSAPHVRSFGKRVVNRRIDLAMRKRPVPENDAEPVTILEGKPYEDPKFEVWVHNLKGEKVSIVPLSSKVFDQTIREDILHRNVVYLKNKERGFVNVRTKTRGEIRGSTRKLYRQKGTGRARRGAARVPHHRGGGKAHGPVPRSFEAKLPKQVRRLGNKIALAARYQEDNLVVIDDLSIEQAKTAAVATLMKNWGWESVLFVMEEEKDRNFELAARNIPDVDTTTSLRFDVKKALLRQKVVISLRALKELQAHLEKDNVPKTAVVDFHQQQLDSESWVAAYAELLKDTPSGKLQSM